MIQWPRATPRRPRRSPAHRIREPETRPSLKNSPIVPDAQGAQAHIDIREAHEEHAYPGPLHVAAVQAAHAIVSLLAPRRSAKHVLDTAHQMAYGMATEGV